MMRIAGVSADCQILDGSAALAVVREAKRICANLVVVGSRRSTGLKRILLGSIAEEIVRTAPCSVLAVRMGA
jgi:nucleotide-binding universal stress UspA family protein